MLILSQTTQKHDLYLNHEKIEEEVEKNANFPIKGITPVITDEIIGRIEKYNNEYFHWH